MQPWLALFLILFAATGVVTHVNFADELVFVLIFSWAVLILIGRGGWIKREIAHPIFWILVAFSFAILAATLNRIPLVVSILGFWQIWRGHIAIIIGFLLLAYGRNIPTWPLIFVLQFNMVFSLLQPLLGEVVMCYLYPACYMEYRSGILRSVGIFGNPNTNAFILSLYVLYVWDQLINGENAKYPKLMLVMSFLALFTTGSRTSILTTPLMMGYMAWTVTRHSSAGRRSTKMWRTYLLGGLLVVAVGGFLASQEKQSTSVGYSLIPDVGVITNTENLGEGYFRAIASVMAFGQFIEHPAIGLGYGSYGTPASFAWPSPYLIRDGLYIEEDSRGFKLSQLDVLIPVIFAESGLLGITLWIFVLWKLTHCSIIQSSNKAVLFKAWLVILLIAMASGPGITHPVVVVLLPFVMNLLFTYGKASEGVQDAV